MLNIREIFGQKVAEPMQSPLTRICPGATALNREEDVERVQIKIYFPLLVEGIYVFDVNYSSRRGEVSRGIKKGKLVPTPPNHSHKPR